MIILLLVGAVAAAMAGAAVGLALPVTAAFFPFEILEVFFFSANF